jgi:excisionase family DNA binding protein
MPKKATTAAMPESHVVEDLRRLLTAHTGTFDLVSSADERITLPQEIVDVLKDAVDIFHEGAAPQMLQSDDWVTTQEAANIVGVSRPSLIKLLNESEIPYSTIGVGSHRRILLKDVMAYREGFRRARSELLTQLVAEASDDGLYDLKHSDYDEPLLRVRGKIK